MNSSPEVIYILESTQLAGGVKVVIEHVNHLLRSGLRAEIYSLQGSPDWINCHGKVTTFDDYEALGKKLRKTNAIKVATYWKTAPVVAKNSEREEGFYLIQDIESVFYRDAGTQKSVLETYDLPLVRLVESRWVERQFKDWRKPCYFIGVGLNHDIFQVRPRIARQKNTVLINAPRMGVLWDLKGMDTVVSTILQLASQMPNFRVISFSIHHEGLNLSGVRYNHVVFPNDKEIAEMYNAASCFLIASSHEGFCLPALEAMACGCPVVATRADGNEEFCRDQETCLLVNTRDPVELANAVVRLLLDEKLAAELSARAQLLSARYRWESVTSNLLSIWNL